MDNQVIKLELTMNEINLVIAGLGELKAGVVFFLLSKIEKEMQIQLKSSESTTL